MKDGDRYIDIPVAIINQIEGSNQPNKDFSNPENLSFVRRFFLSDSITGQAVQSDTHGCQSFDAVPNAVTYLAHSRFYAIGITGESDRVNRPYYVLEYRQVKKVDNDSYPLVDVSYSSLYSLEMPTFYTVWLILLILTLVVAAIVSCSRVWIWLLHHPSNTPEAIPNRGSLLVKAVVYILLQSFGIALFYYLVLLSMYVYIFYKWQKGIYLLLPVTDVSPGAYTAFYTLFGVCAGCLLSSNLWMILRQSQTDIYFIDWEKKAFYTKRLHLNAMVQSVWRTLLVGNEYNEFTTERFLNFNLTVFFAGLFLM
jgi:hypothetical protein